MKTAEQHFEICRVVSDSDVFRGRAAVWCWDVHKWLKGPKLRVKSWNQSRIKLLKFRPAHSGNLEEDLDIFLQLRSGSALIFFFVMNEFVCFCGLFISETHQLNQRRRISATTLNQFTETETNVQYWYVNTRDKELVAFILL